MRKTLALLSVAALLLTATTAFASEGKIKTDLRLKAGLSDRLDMRLDASAEAKPRLGERLQKFDRENTFVYAGTVKSVSGDSFVLTAKHGFRNNDDGSTQDVTIKTNADTKITMLGAASTMASLKAGQTVWTMGKTDASANVASWVHIKAEKKKIMGEVTAKTDTSITLKNNVSGQTTTVPFNDDTKVSINGEAKTMADVQVGDKGKVKLNVVLDVMVAKFVHLFR
jgi:hypothetical protein